MGQPEYAAQIYAQDGAELHAAGVRQLCDAWGFDRQLGRQLFGGQTLLCDFSPSFFFLFCGQSEQLR